MWVWYAKGYDTHVAEGPEKGAESRKQQPLKAGWREKSQERILGGDREVVEWVHFMWILSSNCIF